MKKKKIFISVIALCCIVTITKAQVPSYVPKNGLVGWWPFNGNAKDQSGQKNDGSIVGNTSLTYDRMGNADNAYLFDGNGDYIDCGNASSVNITGSLTISAWIYASDLTTTRGILTKSPLPPIGDAYQLVVGAYVLTDLNFLNKDYGYNVPKLRWVHVVSVFDSVSQTISLYTGGLLNTTISVGFNTIGKSSDNLCLGTHRPSSTPNWSWAGVLDDIGLWNRALDTTEIRKLFLGQNCKIQVTQSGNNTSLIGSTAKFTVSSPDYNPKYQWQADVGSGYIILTNAGQYSGVNDSILIIKNITKTNNNQKFRCYIITDSCSGYSTPAALIVNCVVTQPPRDTAVLMGDKAIFNLYSVDQNAQYQWQIKNGAGYIDLTNAGQYKGTDKDMIEINNVSLNNNSTFRCKVTSSKNSCSDTTTSANLVVSCANLIQTQPQSIIVPKGSDGNFLVASKTSNTTYQWQINNGLGFNNVSNGGQFSGATTNNLTIKAVTFSNDNLLFRCLLKDSICLDTTANATLNVTWAVGINTDINSNLISVFPNPTLSQINVKVDASLVGLNYTIYDQIGRATMIGKLKGENTVIELGELSKGIYLFSTGEKMKSTFKVIKE